MTEMTDERLAAYRGLRDQIRETGEDDEFADAVDEIDRLRAELAATKAENERLREVASDVGACLCPLITPPGYPPEWEERDSDGSCPVHAP